MKRILTTAVALVALGGPAAADLSRADAAKLQDAVERCGKLHGTTVKGKPLLEAGPFLYDLISLADRLGASDPERQMLRIDFRRAAERNPTAADQLAKEELQRLQQEARACQADYAKK